MLGRPELGQRLIGSLQVDISATREELGWHPPVRVDDALLTTAQHFLAARDR
jgi:UDP-glucose 4-epimerase